MINDVPIERQQNFEHALNSGKFDWELAAERFAIGNSKAYPTNIGGRRIEIQSREQMNKSILWVVKMDSWVLGKDGEYHWEPMSSSRTDEFISNTRFHTKEQALSALLQHEKLNLGKPPRLIIPKQR